MSEFRIHHDVNELLSLLRVHGGDGAEVYIDLLQKNRTPYVTTTVSAHSARVRARPGTALGAVGPSLVPLLAEVTFLTGWPSPGWGCGQAGLLGCFSWSAYSAQL